jgi:hypothetical protein
MRTPIDQLLAKARLVQAPYTQTDIDTAVDRVAARIAARLGPAASVAGDGSTAGDGSMAGDGPVPGDGPATGCAPEPCPGPRQASDPGASAAAQDLRLLCETVVGRSDALTHLRAFLARSLPEPPGARVLGCILQLTAREDSARFWWQYAAGAGDPAATYCLYLHHLALGERGEANWWHTQTDAAPAPPEAAALEPEAATTATTLRVLRALKTRTAAMRDPVGAVLAYVPAAVGYVDDDLDLPLPDPDFVDRIKAFADSSAAVPRRRCPSPPLPERRPARRGPLPSRNSPAPC